MRYVDGCLLPMRKKNLQAYRPVAKKAGRSGSASPLTARLSIEICGAGDDPAYRIGIVLASSVRSWAGSSVCFILLNPC